MGLCYVKVVLEFGTGGVAVKLDSTKEAYGGHQLT
jgi:hypothetical protein